MSFRGLGTGEEWTLAVESAGFIDDRRSVRLLAGRETICRVELDSGASAEVRVVDRRGEPREGARIRVVFPDLEIEPVVGGLAGRGPEALSRSARTDSDGVVVLRGLPPARARVGVDQPGYLKSEKACILSKTRMTKVELRLDPGLTIEGRVVDENGQAIHPAMVMRVDPGGQSFMGIDMSSFFGELESLQIRKLGIAVGEDGRFAIGGFAAGEKADILAVAPGFDLGRSETAEAGGRDVVVVCERAARIRGLVLAASDGKPIPAFEAKLAKKAFLIFDQAVVRRDFRDSEDGSFELTDVPRRSFDLVVTAEGFAKLHRGVDATAGDVDCGEIRLHRPSSLAGVTRDTTGRPLAGVKVRVAKGGAADALFMGQMMGQKSVETDDEGRFVLTDIEGNKVRLLADKPAFAPFKSKTVRLRKGERVSDVVLVLSAGGSLHGTLVDAQGQPLSGWRAQATHTSGQGMRFANIDASGEFLIEGLAPGTHKVDCMPADYLTRGSAMPVRGGGPGLPDMGKLVRNMMRWIVSDRVVVRDGERAELSLVFEGEENASVAGLVRVEGRVSTGGRPVDKGTVFLVRAGATTPSHIAGLSAGSFEVNGVRPGTYRLRVQAGFFSGAVGEQQVVEIPAKERHCVDIELPGGRIAGKVVGGEADNPISGAVVSLSRAGATASSIDRFDLGEGTTLSDKDGRFRFEGLAAGRYTVFARDLEMLGGASRSAQLASVALGAGEERGDLRLHLSPGAALRVLVRGPSGARANALVGLLGPTGQPIHLVQRALTDAEGSVTFTGIPEGEYRAGVDAPGLAPKISRAIHAAEGTEPVLEVLVERGNETTLEFDGSLPQGAFGEFLL